MQIGVFTAGDLAPNEIADLAVAAEQAGFDVFAVGEHHNPPYNSSSPTTLLAHIAARTTRLRLSTATTLITTNDPARIAAEYATLDLLAPDRTDLVLGRGNTAKVFGWFGKEIEYGLPLTIEHYETLRTLWPSRPYVWHACTRSPEIADLAAEHDDGLFVFAGQTGHVARYREQAANPRLGVLATEDTLDDALRLHPDRLLIHVRSLDHLRQITSATTRTSTPIATADPSTHRP
ncbi:LLM class flavin-dependent oxidoreductase [Lentzea sp. BCCO 10_0856]|uniref:LLM class flavin-dependent oxidoreductase n=1 Tax=Lentzea miocenica TaxID=3095431 RepID=A0ABU4SS68_9PSEU|nr:LLM class flavin-dependent oxidoreductase [Lentzea sp. BCCO 10_0856]MDX8028745.1 LLM class flavin-dependent oxidoreductase [Lentzea sp. BCCO 10_0856]